MADCTQKHEKFDEIENRMQELGLLNSQGKSFLDEDNDFCIYLGTGGRRGIETVPITIGNHQVGHTYDLDFQPVQHIFAYRYKNEWYLSSFEANPRELERFYAQQPKV
jgi:hypothetical protein